MNKQLDSSFENSGVDVYKKKRDIAWFRSRAGITPADLLCCYRCFSRTVLLSQNIAITTGGFYFPKLMANRKESLVPQKSKQGIQKNEMPQCEIKQGSVCCFYVKKNKIKREAKTPHAICMISNDCINSNDICCLLCYDLYGGCTYTSME